MRYVAGIVVATRYEGNGATSSRTSCARRRTNPGCWSAIWATGISSKQCVGYLLAAAGPLAIGALHDATGSWTASVIVLMVLLVPQGERRRRRAQPGAGRKRGGSFRLNRAGGFAARGSRSLDSGGRYILAPPMRSRELRAYPGRIM
jgi:hypothetical protein